MTILKYDDVIKNVMRPWFLLQYFWKILCSTTFMCKISYLGLNWFRIYDEVMSKKPRLVRVKRDVVKGTVMQIIQQLVYDRFNTSNKQWQLFIYSAAILLFYNHFHNILRLFDVLPNFPLTTSKTIPQRRPQRIFPL